MMDYIVKIYFEVKPENHTGGISLTIRYKPSEEIEAHSIASEIEHLLAQLKAQP